MADWYIRDESGSTAGPFTEAQIKSGLEKNTITDSMSVRQDHSDWVPTQRVRELFAKLMSDGFFVRDCAGKVFGPFTKQRLMEMDRAKQLPKRYWIKQGKDEHSEWTEILTKATSVSSKPRETRKPKPSIPAAPVTTLPRVEDTCFGAVPNVWLG